MRSYHGVAKVRAAEAPLLAALPEGALMRRAAYGLARVCADELRARTGGVAGRSVALIVGSGDNGGDALWAGALLRRRGVAVTAVLLDPARTHAAGLRALRGAGGRIGPLPADPDLVVDAIVGIGGRGPLRPAAAQVVAQVRAPVVAVDLPSGVDPDTGAVDGPAVQAAVTVAFGARKPVHILAAARCGRVEYVPIGLDLPAPDLSALDDADVGDRWPVPGARDDKYSQGVTGVVAGSATYPGAAVLSVGGAVVATAGMVRYAGTACDQVLARWPEVIATDDPAAAGRVQAWVVGPGMGTDDAALGTLMRVLATELPVLVDADGLTLLSEHLDLIADRPAPTLLTPHAGEFARLAGAGPGPDRVGAAAGFAREHAVTVLLKGRATVIADPDGAVLVNEAGGSWEATAGSGDVLAGMAGSLLAAGLAPGRAAAMAAHVHSRAAAMAAHAGGSGGGDGKAAPTSSSELLGWVRPAIRDVRSASVRPGVAEP
ncbi:NAD(P)H-hydrate epimerase [Rhodococcus sp. D2-41]|uniref:Bifunctional NAD(P)H-hydrate repair enzyme n=1 Tax=Speluncibacter jeojiensis TaxID=2710754 RepID=A0A9X4LZZ7_9ACTN|nr:NAD(P)H-hydrate epimerase [Rhodococcus sp. D2-41]MDG3008984.1 NAD(P)H-hydrate epimerase [Rhodococcus sp. D2-41]MDG3015495.1 NAD(P)H-hydrate epimerase [Corynebacteriales bacterium D3-21]